VELGFYCLEGTNLIYLTKDGNNYCYHLLENNMEIGIDTIFYIFITRNVIGVVLSVR